MKNLFILVVALIIVNSVMAQWVPQNSGTAKNLNSVFFTNESTGYVAGDSGVILKTFNAGINWDSLSNGIQINFSSIHFPVADTGYAAGNSYGNAILKTTDAGTTWTVLISSYSSYYSVYFTAADIGYVTTSHDMGSGDVMKTIDGGNTWNYTSVGWQFGIYFPTTITGYSVGVDGQIWSHGTINKTSDGGSTWVNIFSLDDIRLNSVYFIDSDNGYVAGNSGTILKTTDGGISWANQTSGTIENLTSVFFTDVDTGYVVGDIGTILKTTNGGITWTNQTSGTIENLTSVFFTGSNIGYVVGSSGTILKTTNGGGFPAGIKEITNYELRITNFPNPTIQSTTFSYSIKVSGHVTIQIFNSFGQLVAEPLSINQAAGEHKMTWNAENLPSGLYFYRIKSGNEFGRGKMVVVK